MINKCFVLQRRFVIPTTEEQSKIPMARVNHNKIMVTEKAVWSSTSNWSGDYFNTTAGMSLILEDVTTNNTVDTIRKQFEDIFDRDWNSDYVVDAERPTIREEPIEMPVETINETPNKTQSSVQSSSACEISKHIGFVPMVLAICFLRP